MSKDRQKFKLMLKQKKESTFKLNKKYYLDKEDYVIIREDKLSYYVVDSISIDRCDDKDERGLIPIFEINKSTYRNEQVEQDIVEFMHSIGVEL